MVHFMSPYPQVTTPLHRSSLRAASPKKHSSEPEDDMEQEIISFHILQQQVRLKTMQQRLVRTDIPLSLMAGGLAYLLYKSYNAESQIVQDFAQLTHHRDKALSLGQWLTQHGMSRPMGQTILHPDSAGTLSRVNLALTMGASPLEMAEPIKRLKLRNPMTAQVIQMEREVLGYTQQFHRVVGNASGLEKLAIPIIAKPLGISTHEVKAMARQNPSLFIKSLLSKGLTNPRYNQAFFTKLFSELRRASNLMAMIVAGTVAVGMIGIFLSRFELAKKRSQH